MGENRMPSRVSWALIVSLLLIIAIRLPYVERAFNSQDVGQIAYSANRAVEGQMLYRDTVDYKPPMALTIFAVTFHLFGKSMTAVNVVALLWALAATVLVFLLTHVLFGRTAAVGAALFYAVFANGDTVSGTAPSYDYWMLPFMVAAVYCFVRGQGARDKGQRKAAWWLFIAGVCSGLAVTSKQHALFNFVAILNTLAFAAWHNRAARRQLIPQVLLMGAGFAAAWLPFVSYFWSQGALGAFVSSLSPQHNVGYMGTRTWADALFSACVQFTRQITRDFILWAFALFGLAHLLISRKESMDQYAIRNTQYASLLWLWTFWSFVGVSITKRFYDHYFLQVMPAFSVLAGYVWGLCFDAKPFFRQIPRWAMVTVIVLGFLWSVRYLHPRQRLQHAYALLMRQYEPTELEEVGEYVRAHSTPQDTLYVWGWKPEIYYFADRKAPTKWWEWGIESGMWSQIAPEFKRNKPKFIVVNGTLGGPPEFQDYVRRNYEPDRQIAQFQILRRRIAIVRENG